MRPLANRKKNNSVLQSLSRDHYFLDNAPTATLFGDLNKNLQTVEQCCGVTIHVRGNGVHITGLGHEVDLAAELLEQLYCLIRKGLKVFSSDFAFGLRVLESNPHARLLTRSFLIRFILSPKIGSSRPKPATRRSISTPSAPMISSLASVRPVPVRPIWRWPWQLLF